MTVSTFAKDGPYAGTGVVGQEFAITFEFFDTDEIIATTREVATGTEDVLTETTDYTITGTGSDPYTGGTLTLVASLATNCTLTISRSVDQTQTTDLVESDVLAADTLEDRFDKLVLMVQDVQEQVDRCLKVPITDGSTVEAACELDNAVERASSYLTFDASGLPTITSGVVSSEVTVTSFMETVLDDTNGDTALATLGISSWLISNFIDVASAAAARTALGVTAAALLNDITLSTDSQTQAPTEHAVKGYVDTSVATMNNKTLVSPVINTQVSGTAFLDEDAMTSNSATKLASQQSIKAYVDNSIAALHGLPSYCQYSYTVANNTAGGTATNGAWRTRAINTEDVDADTIGAVASNQITLDAGTYDFDIDASFYAVGQCIIRLRNTTAGTTLAQSVNDKPTSGGADANVLHLAGRITVAAGQALEVQYYCTTTNADDGLGLACNFGESEIYLIARFWQVDT